LRRLGFRTTLVLRGRGGGPGASLSLYRDSSSKMHGSGAGVEPRSGRVTTTRVNTGSLDEAVATVLLLPRSWGGILAENMVESSV
jgi:hypothetical protein